MVKSKIAAAVFLSLTAMAEGESLLPTAIGTTWEYRLVQEPEAAPTTATDRIDGLEKVDRLELFKLVRRRDGALFQTDFLAVDDQGVFVSARLENGRAVAMNPPLPMVMLPLRVGGRWPSSSVGEVCEITSEEDVEVAAGKFRAFRIHCARSSSVSSVIDRWFVPGVGVIKEITTARAPTGDLLQRSTLELQKLPTVVPVPKVAIGAKKLSVDVASTPEGAAATRFSSAVASVCARWSGSGLRAPAKVRAVWIAEDVGGVAPPDYQIDEASSTVTEPNSHGIFTLGRPGSGWAEGKYRVEFYLDGAFVDAVNVKIGK